MGIMVSSVKRNAAYALLIRADLSATILQFVWGIHVILKPRGLGLQKTSTVHCAAVSQVDKFLALSLYASSSICLSSASPHLLPVSASDVLKKNLTSGCMMAAFTLNNNNTL